MKRAAVVRKSWPCEKLQGTHTYKEAASAVNIPRTGCKVQPPECILHRDAVYLKEEETIYRPRKTWTELSILGGIIFAEAMKTF